jgi:hypothetical protein
MKRFLKILLLSFGMGTFVATVVCFAVLVFGSYYWQVGYTALEWVEKGLQELEQNNKLPNYDDYHIELVKFDKVPYSKIYNFVYKIDFYEYTDTDNVGDIDLWYGKSQTYTVYIGLDSECFYNRFQSSIRVSKSIPDDCKFEKCLDFDIFVGGMK